MFNSLLDLSSVSHSGSHLTLWGHRGLGKMKIEVLSKREKPFGPIFPKQCYEKSRVWEEIHTSKMQKMRIHCSKDRFLIYLILSMKSVSFSIIAYFFLCLGSYWSSSCVEWLRERKQVLNFDWIETIDHVLGFLIFQWIQWP